MRRTLCLLALCSLLASAQQGPTAAASAAGAQVSKKSSVLYKMVHPAPPAAAPPRPQSTEPQPPTAKPDDVKSMDAIIHAVYDTISGPAGQKRDWDRFRSLFFPNAHLIPTGPQPSGKIAPRALTVEEYVKRTDPLLMKDSFFEGEIARRTEQFADIAHAWSTYASRRTKDGAPFARGINSFQLFHDGERWWIVNVYWQAESAARPIPKEYLPKK